MLVALLAASCGQAGISTSTPDAAGATDATVAAQSPSPSAEPDTSPTTDPTVDVSSTATATMTLEPTATATPSPTVNTISTGLELSWFMPTAEDLQDRYIPLEGEAGALAVQPQLEGFELSSSWTSADPSLEMTPLLLRVQCTEGLNPNEVVTTIETFADRLSANGQAPHEMIVPGEHGNYSRIVAGRFAVDRSDGVAEFDGKVVFVEYGFVLCSYEAYDDVEVSLKLIDPMIEWILVRVEEREPIAVIDPTPTANATPTPASTATPEPTLTPASSPTPEAHAYLYDLLPTLADLPEGFELIEEETVSLDDGLSDITEEEAERLRTWGFTGAAYRAFAAEDRDPNMSLGVLAAAAVYEFGSSTAAQDATRWIMDDVLADSEGDDFEPADIPQIGDLSLAAQAVMSNPDPPEAGGNSLAIITVADGAFVYIYWWNEYSPEANALDDGVALAQAVAAR